jgi:hypothetical protein
VGEGINWEENSWETSRRLLKVIIPIQIGGSEKPERNGSELCPNLICCGIVFSIERIGCLDPLSRVPEARGILTALMQGALGS